MNNNITTTINRKIVLLTLWFTVLNGIGFAQTKHRPLSFNTGELYEKTTRVNSNVILERLGQTYTIKSSSSMSKVYHITKNTGSGFTVDATTIRLTDSLSAMGNSMGYDSDKPIDSTSMIQKRLNTLVGETSNITLGNRDTILAINKPDIPMVNDTLMAFAGLPAPLAVGGRLGLTIDYPEFSTKKQGFSWEKSDNRMGLTSIFKIQSRNDKTTTIAFVSSTRQPTSNSNTNGILIADNKTGLILETQLRTTKIDQQIFNKVLYTSSRSIAISETCSLK